MYGHIFHIGIGLPSQSLLQQHHPPQSSAWVSPFPWVNRWTGADASPSVMGLASAPVHRNQNGCTSKYYPLKYETGKKASQEVATPHARDAYDINKSIRIRNI
jgi:hypothetical protein